MRGFARTAVLSLTLSATAHAQKVDTQPNHPETLKILVSGGVNFDFVHRDRNLTLAGAGAEDFGSSTSDFEGDVRVRLDVELTEKIHGIVSLRTRRASGGGAGFIEPLGGTDRLGSVGFFRAGGAAARDLDRFGANPEELNLFVDEASVSLRELFVPGFDLAAGIVPAAFDLRGKGSAFFFDPRHSSSFAKNAGPGGGGTFLGLSDELQPAGVHAAYSKDSFSAGLVLLPAIIEGGAQSADEAAYALWAMYALDSIGKGSRIGAIVALDQFAGGNTAVYTIGLGGDLQGLLEGLEIYAEIYFQFGDALRGTAGDIDSRAWAMQVGAEYRLLSNVWFALNFKYLTGDDDVTDDRNATFLSYENVNDTLILEDQYFGLDLDTNYWTIQAAVGAAFTIGSGSLQNNLEVSARFALCYLTEQVLTFDGSGTDDIGHEIDLRARVLVSKQVSFHTGFGFLFGSDVLRDVSAGGSDDFGRTAYLWTLGMSVGF